MISVFPWWTFWIYIFCNVQISYTVRIFENTIAAESSMFTAYQPRVISKTCMLIPQYGPCRGRIRMWYYEPQSKNCSTFHWGGCQGNGNRFDTFERCWGTCMSKPGVTKYRPRYCSLTFDYGFCFGAVERWYYDHVWKVCKSTIYSGCGGNQNNFYSLEQCEAVCRFGRGAITTLRTATGGTRKVLIINPWNTTPRRGMGQSTHGKAEANNATTATVFG